MIISLLAAVSLLAPVPAETTITFGIVIRDLTGDTIPEVMTLTAAGRSIDDLALSFTIESSGKTLYAQKWRLTRARHDAGARSTEAQHRARVAEYGKVFFGDAKFLSPDRFLSQLRSSARLHIPLIPEVISRQMTVRDSTRARLIWDEMQKATITIFEFSPGGDAIMSIGWSPRDRRFYNLVECC